MPSKKRKYNARFPAGRIKKIMQTDEEVGKVAQAVPIIISRTLELFVESLLGKALQVTTARNAKTLSPSHVKQCILAEARFDFLRDLVKNIPDVSAAEEKELMSAETSPNSSRFTEAAPPRRIVREDSNSSSSGEVIRVPSAPSTITSSKEQLKRAISFDTEIPNKTIKIEPGTPGTSAKIEPGTPGTSARIEPGTPGTSARIEPGTPGTPVRIEPGTPERIHPLIPGTSIEIKPGPATTMSPILAKIKQKILTQNEMTLKPLKIEPISDTAIDLSKKDPRPVRTANFYQETLIDEIPHRSVIKVNPTYSTPQPSTSYTNLNPVEPVRKIDLVPKPTFERHNSLPQLPRTPVTPITPVINIDFSKNIARPEIKVLDVAATAASIVSVPKYERTKQVSRQNSKSKIEVKKVEVKPIQAIPVDIDSLNSGNLQIDEDYDT